MKKKKSKSKIQMSRCTQRAHRFTKWRYEESSRLLFPLYVCTRNYVNRMTVRGREKCVTASRREIDLARTSYHSPRKAAAAAAASLFSSPFPISAGITFVGGLSATSICRLEVRTIRKASSRTKSLRENRPPLTTIPLSLFRARARFWRNCFFVLAFPPFDPRFPNSSSFSSFYPSPVCPIAIVRDDSRVEKKKRKERRKDL